MRLLFGRPVLAALAVSLASVGAAYADGHGGAGCCNPCDSCCAPRIRYKTVYQNCYEDQWVTVCQTVSKTVMQEQRYTVCKPVWEEKVVQVKKCVSKPVWEEKQVTVCCGEWKTEAYCVPGKCVTRKCRLPDTCCFDPCTCKSRRVKGETVCYTEQLPPTTCYRKVWVPREEVRTVKCCKMVQEEVIENVTVKTCKMVKEEVVKQVPVTVCEKVPVQVKKTVCRKVPVQVAYCDCNGGHGLLSSLRDRCSGLFRFGHRSSCDTCGYAGCNGCGGTYTAPAAPAAPAAETIKAMPAPTQAK